MKSCVDTNEYEDIRQSIKTQARLGYEGIRLPTTLGIEVLARV